MVHISSELINNHAMADRSRVIKSNTSHVIWTHLLRLDRNVDWGLGGGVGESSTCTSKLKLFLTKFCAEALSPWEAIWFLRSSSCWLHLMFCSLNTWFCSSSSRSLFVTHSFMRAAFASTCFASCSRSCRCNIYAKLNIYPAFIKQFHTCYNSNIKKDTVI